MPVLVVFCVVPSFAQTFSNDSDGAKTQWRYSKEENPLYGKSFDRFTLMGKYLKTPSTVGSEQPKLIVGCMHGKFSSGEFSLGTVAQFSETRSFKGVRQAQLDMRIDERKKTEEWLEVSNDGQTLFFDKTQLVQFLTGRLLGHPSDSNSLSRRLILGVVEAFGNEVIVQFDMPEDASEIVRSCGLEWGKKK